MSKSGKRFLPPSVLGPQSGLYDSFSVDSIISGAVSSGANRDASDAIASYLMDADSQLDIDGDGESKPLTDGLLLIRYLFGFSGDSLVSGTIGSGAERDTAEEVDAYIKGRVPLQ